MCSCLGVSNSENSHYFIRNAKVIILKKSADSGGSRGGIFSFYWFDTE